MSKDYAQAQNMCVISNYDKSEDIRCKTPRIRIINNKKYVFCLFKRRDLYFRKILSVLNGL